MKSESRVSAIYKKGTKDWQAQYSMLLDDGVTCADCLHCGKCESMFGGNKANTACQFYPPRFNLKQAKP